MLPKLLIIEDSPSMLHMYKGFLQQEPLEVIAAETGAEGLRVLRKERPALLLLDLKLPDIDGQEILEAIAAEGIETAAVVMTAHGSVNVAVEAMRLGADDYISKPFSIRELVARIHAVLRRKKRYERELETFEFGEVLIDFTARTINRRGRTLELSPREFDLLAYFVRHPNEVIDRRQILNKVWGFNYYGTARTIDNFVTKLRQKLEPDPTTPKHFVTARGIGYKFVP